MKEARGCPWGSIGLVGAAVAIFSATAVLSLAACGVSPGEPDLSPSVSPTASGSSSSDVAEPLPSATPSPAAVPDVPYQVVGGVTVSQYLPAAQPISEGVWDQVTSGWTLAAFEGGLLDSGRQQDWEGTAILGYFDAVGDAVSGPRVLYLVSPGGAAYEVANLSGLGVGDVLVWDSQHEVALVTDQLSLIGQTANRVFSVLDLRSGALGPWFSVGGGVTNQFEGIWPIDGGWAFIGHTWDAEWTPTTVRAIVDDSGRPIQGAATLDPDSTFTGLSGAYLVEYSSGGFPGTGVAPTLHVRSDFGRGRPVEYPMPTNPHGDPSSYCRVFRLATPEAIAVECGASEGEDWQGTMLSTVAVFDPATGTFETTVDWDTNTLMGYDSQDVLRCVRGDAVYGLFQPGQTDYVMGGLRVRSASRYEVLSPPPGVYMAIQCEGAVGSEFVVRGSGPLLALNPATGAWRTLLPAPVNPATGDEPERLVAGVTDLGVFVAP